MAYSPDGKWLASVAGNWETPNAGGEVFVVDAATGKQRFELTGHSARVAGLAFAPDGKSLATGSWDKSVRLWSAPGRD